MLQPILIAGISVNKKTRFLYRYANFPRKKLDKSQAANAVRSHFQEKNSDEMT